MLKIKEKKEKNWLIRSSDSSSYRVAVSEIAANLGINPIVAKLLYNRGYTNLASAKAFVYMESEMLLDPFKYTIRYRGLERFYRNKHFRCWRKRK